MKKFLSIVLALSLVFTMLPTVFASGETEPELELKYNYDFGAKGYEGIVSETIDKAWIVANGDAENPVFAENNTDPWFVDGSINVYDNRFALTSDKPASGQAANALNATVAKNAINGGSATVIRIKIPEAGTYNAELSYYAYSDMCKYKVYLVPLSDVNDTYKGYITFSCINIINNFMPQMVENNGKYYVGEVDMYKNTSTKTLTDNDFGGKTVEVLPEDVGEYYLILRTSGSSITPASTLSVNLDSFKLFAAKEETLDAEFDYTEEEFVGGGATLRAFAVYGDGEASEEDIIETREITMGETVSVSAPISVTKGDKTYNFLYWAKGATDKKQIVSYNASFTYKAYAEANNLIAVYKAAGAESTKKEYYNANGQLMLNGETLPSLPGYGEATGWKDAGNGVYVAEYAPLEKNIEVTVNGEKENYAYGDTVTCIANAPEGKVFMYWTKNDEIVSTESTYTFSAWENTTVTAVYGDKAPTLGKTMRKIVLDTLASGDYTAVMAEFIGFSDAVEKGIIFGGKKIPMLTDKSQFTLTNDTGSEVTVTGYAIINDNGTLKEISDGSISVE